MGRAMNASALLYLKSGRASGIVLQDDHRHIGMEKAHLVRFWYGENVQQLHFWELIDNPAPRLLLFGAVEHRRRSGELLHSRCCAAG